MAENYYIRAVWDAGSKVCSETDVPGLVVEADSLGEFIAIAEELLPEILKANLGETAAGHIVSGAFEIAV